MRGPGGRILFILALALGAAVAVSPRQAAATPEFSERTGESCTTCHLEGDGGRLARAGLEFAASGYRWPPTGGYRVLGPIKGTVRLFIGFLHVTAAFIWFGTILYVHLMLRPAYAARGLPKGEVVLGLVSMVLVGVSGVLLTVSRIRSLEVLVSSPWGLTLLVKIGVYLLMITSALVVVTVIGPNLKKRGGAGMKPSGSVYGPDNLAAFDGREGRPALVACGGRVYDVSGLKLWRGGVHMKHNAGMDLTEMLKRAPHGAEKLEGVPVAGTFDPLTKRRLTAYQKAFYLVAYMNLSLVFVVLATISYWRWGLG